MHIICILLISIKISIIIVHYISIDIQGESKFLGNTVRDDSTQKVNNIKIGN